MPPKRYQFVGGFESDSEEEMEMETTILADTATGTSIITERPVVGRSHKRRNVATTATPHTLDNPKSTPAVDPVPVPAEPAPEKVDRKQVCEDYNPLYLSLTLCRVLQK